MGFSDPGVSVPLLCWSHVSVHVVLCWGHRQKQKQEADVGLSWTWSSRLRRVCGVVGEGMGEGGRGGRGAGVLGVCLVLFCKNSPCANRPYWYWGKETERCGDRTANPSPEEPLYAVFPTSNPLPARARVPRKDPLTRSVVLFISSSPEKPAGGLNTFSLSSFSSGVSPTSPHCL